MTIVLHMLKGGMGCEFVATLSSGKQKQIL